ncbi:MAG TPA: hypothetical protein VG274_05640, partial [Rhizomicrobium sp.]|nr:hypothetical protein [Rhizomicrobium sp.]
LTKALTEENAKSPAAAPADVRSTVCDLAWPDTEGDKRQDLELSAKTPGSAGIEVAGESLEDFPSAQADNPSDAYGEEIEPIPETYFRQEAEWCESHASRSDEPEWAHETVEISELEWT